MWRGVEAVAALLVLGFFLYALRGILNPLVLFILLWIVMIPFRGRPGHSALLATAGALTLTWLLSTTGSLLAPFVLALVLAYILDPLVDLLQRRRIPRAGAILLLTLPALAILAALVLVAIPAAVGQLGSVLDRTPVLIDRVEGWIDSLGDWWLRVNVPLVDEQRLLEQVRGVDQAAVLDFLRERQEALVGWLMGAVLGFGRGIGTVLTILGYVFLTPVLTFYLLRDWDRLTRSVSELLPRDRRSSLVSFAAECDRLLSQYLRGQITVAVTIGAITGAGLALLGFPYAAALGLIVAIFSVVPYLGLVLSLIPAIFIALVSAGSVGVALLKVAVVYGVAQGLEGAVISPKIVGGSVGLHPVWVVLALAVGGFFFGFVGLLIGVPGAVVAKVLIQRGIERYRSSQVYLGTSGTS